MRNMRRYSEQRTSTQNSWPKNHFNLTIFFFHFHNHFPSLPYNGLYVWSIKISSKNNMHKKTTTSKWIFGQNFALKPFRHTLCCLNWRSADIEQRLSGGFSPKRILTIGSKYLWSLSHELFPQKEEIIREISKREIFSLRQSKKISVGMVLKNSCYVIIFWFLPI